MKFESPADDRERPCTEVENGGFTLVELLAVIGIISLLMAILVPVVSRARRSATGVACQSNIRQIQAAVLMYAHDTRGFLPGGGRALGLSLKGEGIWYRQIDNQLSRNRQVYSCPGATAEKSQYLGSDLDYLANAHLIRVGRALNSSVVRRPAQYACIIEADRSMDNFQWTADDFNSARLTWSSDDPQLPSFGRHAAGINVAFMDGHVANIKLPPRTATPPHLGDLGDCSDSEGLWAPATPCTAFLRRTNSPQGF